MTLKVTKSTDEKNQPPVVMLLYGEGGVGKTSVVGNADHALIGDCENGAKFLGQRGIKCDIAQIQKWEDMKEFLVLALSEKYQTVSLDPLDELMNKLKAYMIATQGSKLAQSDGSPTMAGWGWLKTQLINVIKVLRDSGVNVVLVAHVTENQDEDKIVKRPKIQTKVWEDIVDLVDIVAYMTSLQDNGSSKRVLIIDPGNDKFISKDRTGRLEQYVEPDFNKIVKACRGKDYAWTKPKEAKKKPAPKKKATKSKATKTAEAQLKKANKKK